MIELAASALQSVIASPDNVAVESDMDMAPPYACATKEKEIGEPYLKLGEHSFVKEGRVQAHGNCNRQLHSLSPCADCSRSDSIQFVLFRSNSLSFDPIRVVSLRSHSIGRA